MKTTLQKFTEKYDVVSNDCWEWKTTSKILYGSFWFKGKTHRAHRVSYELFVGDIPEGKLVLHICDNPKCVNPKHLVLGSQQDNMTDKCNKGRQPKGSSHASWKGGARASRAEYHKTRYHALKTKEI